MRNLLFASAALFASVLTAAGPNPSHAATTCEDLLANNTYSCLFKAANGFAFPHCATFTNPGAQSSEFDLTLSGSVLSCACHTAGGLNKPKFGASTSFQCVSSPDESSSYALSGKAVGTNIKKGQLVHNSGQAFFFECKLDPSCSVNGPVQ